MGKRRSMPSIADIRKERARRSHLKFMEYCWNKSADDPFTPGFHTKHITDRLDRALKEFDSGKSVYIRIAVHPRAGKSDIVSRFLPPHFIAKFPDYEVITASYSGSKAMEFGRAGRKIIQSRQFRELYPDVRLSGSSSASNDWRIEKRDPITNEWNETMGRVYSSGLMHGLSGNGGHLMILDDYTATRAAVESTVQRENMWVSFTEEFMTRRAPHTIVVILATQWHEDDIHGRIANRNNPEHPDYDPNFPVFEYIGFPARAEDYTGEGEYSGKYLFGERFSDQWYEEQYATLGKYAASALFDCNPVPRAGGILDTSHLIYHDSMEEVPKNLKMIRVWDYAHSAKERTGDDPDFTGGTLLAYKQLGFNQYIKQMEYALWVFDYVQFRLPAPQRDAKIREIARKDGTHVKVVVERSVDSIDGASYLKMQLRGIRVVDIVNCKGDKVTRCEPVEPIFSAGRVHVMRGTWNRVWLDGLQRFDGSGRTHDEMVDNITAGYVYMKTGAGYSPLRVGVV